ncbi:MAG: aspartate kinase [Pirellulales bacterium]|nr:aspartate kinase [Planctomycetales bacterium]
MPLIVQKFGGTSVADSQKILAAARKAIRAKNEGNQVVVVVSAMGKNTDALIQLAGEINPRPPAREMDMLLSTGEQVSVALMAMAIEQLGHRAISMTGLQMGIKTDSTHTKARIHSIDTDRMRRALDDGNIVIAAGFQGVDDNLNITTLGRGGSDTTAVALAAVLGADACEINTDVDGVYTTDPRLLPEARLMKQVSYDEMLELASLGAGVMHSRAIEFGKKFSVPIHVRSSFADMPGTMIVDQPESSERAVSGAALVRNEALITVEGAPDVPGVCHTIFSKLAARSIPVDMIVQNVSADGRTDVSFTVLENELVPALECADESVVELGAAGVRHDAQVAKASVVGLGMARQTGVARQLFDQLAAEGINVLMISTSEIKISVLVDREEAARTLRTAHQGFELDKPPTEPPPQATLPAKGAKDVADVVARLHGMEDLLIDGISLDETQATVTVCGVPDQPGVADRVFNEVADAGIFVDMIVQSFSRRDSADITFSVPRADVEKSVATVERLRSTIGFERVTHLPSVAKLSVAGIGLRSHGGIAVRVFKALADEDINIAMINTSEMQINVVIDGEAGSRGLAALQKQFGDMRA